MIIIVTLAAHPIEPRVYGYASFFLSDARDVVLMIAILCDQSVMLLGHFRIGRQSGEQGLDVGRLFLMYAGV